MVERGCNVVGDSGRVSKRSLVRNGAGDTMLNGKRCVFCSCKFFNFNVLDVFLDLLEIMGFVWLGRNSSIG